MALRGGFFNTKPAAPKAASVSKPQAGPPSRSLTLPDTLSSPGLADVTQASALRSNAPPSPPSLSPNTDATAKAASAPKPSPTPIPASANHDRNILDEAGPSSHLTRGKGLAAAATVSGTSRQPAAAARKDPAPTRKKKQTRVTDHAAPRSRNSRPPSPRRQSINNALEKKYARFSVVLSSHSLASTPKLTHEILTHFEDKQWTIHYRIHHGTICTHRSETISYFRTYFPEAARQDLEAVEEIGQYRIVPPSNTNLCFCVEAVDTTIAEDDIRLKLESQGYQVRSVRRQTIATDDIENRRSSDRVYVEGSGPCDAWLAKLDTATWRGRRVAVITLMHEHDYHVIECTGHINATRVCWNCMQLGHIQTRCPSPKKCGRCSEAGHCAFACKAVAPVVGSKPEILVRPQLPPLSALPYWKWPLEAKIDNYQRKQPVPPPSIPAAAANPPAVAPLSVAAAWPLLQASRDPAQEAVRADTTDPTDTTEATLRRRLEVEEERNQQLQQRVEELAQQVKDLTAMMQSMMTTLASVSATQQQPAASQHRAADREEQQPPTKRQETDEPTDHESDKSERASNPTVPAASDGGEGGKSSNSADDSKASDSDSSISSLHSNDDDSCSTPVSRRRLRSNSSSEKQSPKETFDLDLSTHSRRVPIKRSMQSQQAKTKTDDAASSPPSSSKGRRSRRRDPA